MFIVTVTEKGGHSQIFEFTKDEISIGRIPGNDIMLPKSNISKKHARINRGDDGFVITDAKSTNGTYVNGTRLSAPQAFGEDDHIIIGDFTLDLRLSDGLSAPAKAAEPFADDWAEPEDKAAAPLPTNTDLDNSSTVGNLPQQDAPFAESRLSAAPNVSGQDQAQIAGIIEGLLADDSVEAVMINGPGAIYVERGGRLQKSSHAMTSRAEVEAVLTALLAQARHKPAAGASFVDVRLPSGTRLHAVLPSLAPAGPCLTLHRPNHQPLRVDDLVAGATLTPEMAGFLETCVAARRNILICGGAKAGKTTLLSVLASSIPAEERIITIEEIAALKLEQEHVVSLEAPPDGGGTLVRHALRMRPERLLIDDLDSQEAGPLVHAMANGHDGTIATSCANGVTDALRLLGDQIALHGVGPSPRAILALVGRAVSIIVHLVRFIDGSRRVVDISEVHGVEGERLVTEPIFVFTAERFDQSGKLVGTFAPTGVTPRFLCEPHALGIGADLEIFKP